MNINLSFSLFYPIRQLYEWIVRGHISRDWREGPGCKLLRTSFPGTVFFAIWIPVSPAIGYIR